MIYSKLLKVYNYIFEKVPLQYQLDKNVLNNFLCLKILSIINL